MSFFVPNVLVYLELILFVWSLTQICFVICSDCGCNKIQRLKTTNSDVTKSDNSIRNCPKSQLSDFIHDDMVKIDEGDYFIGTDEPIFQSDNESPLKSVHVMEFYIDRYEVSNEQFREFVEHTGYETQAEQFGDSFVFEGLLSELQLNEYTNFRVASAPWWYKINNTFWRQPEGIGSTIENRMRHPVVHVSWIDANEFCKWKNKRLPTEIEWEVACRGGRKNRLYPWGNKLMPKNQHWANIWQGEFPTANSGDDGYYSTCPVDRFKQNDYQLYNIVGNVWEWTDTLWNDQETINSDIDLNNLERVKKGGSYLCHKSYCYRYRCAARSSNTANSSAGNLGFRCVHS